MHPSFTHSPHQQKSAAAPASTDKLGCTLLSKCGKPNDTAGSLTDGKCQSQQWTVVSDLHRITCSHRLFTYLRAAAAVGTMKRGASCSSCNKKAAAPQKDAATVFPQQNLPRAVLAASVFLHSSSSPDLRIVSSVQPSRISPMTGFRLAQNLHAYSGGTVRDLHPVFYSPTGLLPSPQALEQYIHYQYKIALSSGFVNSYYLPPGMELHQH